MMKSPAFTETSQKLFEEPHKQLWDNYQMELSIGHIEFCISILYYVTKFATYLSLQDISAVSNMLLHF